MRTIPASNRVGIVLLGSGKSIEQQPASGVSTPLSQEPCGGVRVVSDVSGSGRLV